MTVAEYTRSLLDQDLTQQEMYDKVMAFKKQLEADNKNVEEVKEDVEVKQDDSQTTGSELGVKRKYRIRIGKWIFTAVKL